MAAIEDALDALGNMGFTSLEAEAYVCLIRTPGATGYRVAQTLGKPAANTYKAIETLTAKGALIVDESGARTYRAVPHRELLARFERTFQERRRQAAQALDSLASVNQDSGMYRLQHADQVRQRATAMLEEATDVVLVDAMPEPLRALVTPLQGAIDRGVRVAVLAYAPLALDGALVIDASAVRDFQQLWPGHFIDLSVDGRQFLSASFDASLEGVLHALWTANDHVACFRHDGTMAHLVAATLEVGIDLDESRDALRARREQLRPFSMLRTPGYRDVCDRIAAHRTNPNE